MSEITRKALEGMGFKSRGGLNYYSMVFDSGWVSISYNIAWDKEPKVSCSMFAKGKRLKHVRTLPQLRRLIRSLFGDDALPRRELSSITDEELRDVYDFAFSMPDNVSITGGLWVKVECKNNKLTIFMLSGEVTIQSIDQNAKSPLQVCNHLIDELDMHLPAFHDSQ